MQVLPASFIISTSNMQSNREDDKERKTIQLALYKTKDSAAAPEMAAQEVRQ